MYKAIKDNKIIAISDNDNQFKFLVKDKIEIDNEHTTNDYLMAGSEYVLNDDEKAIQIKKANVRDIRNEYLEKYVDPYQLIIRWNTLTEEEQKDLIAYREYLLNYTNQDEWWENNPLTFDEWKNNKGIEYAE